MTDDILELEDLPPADEQAIRAHAADLIAMAEGLGLTELRYASGNRVVVTRTARVEPLGEHRLAEEASYFLGRRVRVYSAEVWKNPGVGADLMAATPL